MMPSLPIVSKMFDKPTHFAFAPSFLREIYRLFIIRLNQLAVSEIAALMPLNFKAEKK